jgi:hypothetical protein
MMSSKMIRNFGDHSANERTFLAWVRTAIAVMDLASIVAQDEQAIQKPERNRRHHEKIHRDDPVGMIAQKGRPALGRRAPPPRQVLGYTRLPDIDAELEQLAVDPRCTP